MRDPHGLSASILTALSLAWPAACGTLPAPPAAPHHRHHHDLHFSHPLIAESPSPDTKVRGDYFFANQPPAAAGEPGTSRHTVRLEAEYAFTRWLSVEVDLPHTLLDPGGEPTRSHLDEVSVALKAASFAFAEHGLLLGGGVEIGLPSGRDSKGIGSNNVIDIGPFVDFGLQVHRLELVGFASFDFPTRERGANEADLELGWNLSGLYHLTPHLDTLLELNGTRVLGGEQDGTGTVDVTPGFKVQPFADPGLQIGLGISLPLTDCRDFHVMPAFSIFYHF